MKRDTFTDQELGDSRTTAISSLTSSPSTTTTNVSPKTCRRPAWSRPPRARGRQIALGIVQIKAALQ